MSCEDRWEKRSSTSDSDSITAESKATHSIVGPIKSQKETNSLSCILFDDEVPGLQGRNETRFTILLRMRSKLVCCLQTEPWAERWPRFGSSSIYLCCL